MTTILDLPYDYKIYQGIPLICRRRRSEATDISHNDQYIIVQIETDDYTKYRRDKDDYL